MQENTNISVELELFTSLSLDFVIVKQLMRKLIKAVSFNKSSSVTTVVVVGVPLTSDVMHSRSVLVI